MRVKHIMQGRFMNHPLHPALVHLPIGAWLVSPMFDVLSRSRKKDGFLGNAFVPASYYAILIGVLAAVPTAAAGLAEYVDVPRASKPKRVATAHMVLNVALLSGYAAQLFVRDRDAVKIKRRMIAWNLVQAAALGYSGYLGGLLSYNYRVGERTEPLVGVPASVEETVKLAA